MTIGFRLRKARKKRELSGVVFAERMGVSTAAVSQWESDDTVPTPDKIAKAAKILKVSTDWLIDEVGVGPDGDVGVAVAGFIGAGGEITFLDDFERGAGLDYVERPPGLRKDVVAVRVRGESMLPIFEDGDTLFYTLDDRREPSQLMGKRACIVRLRDGKTYLKRIRHGSRKGRWTLESTNWPDIVDVQIEWAVPVRWISKP